MSKTIKPAAKTAKTTKNTNVPESSTEVDKANPEIHPERHAANGMTELPTGGGTTAGEPKSQDTALAGNHQAEVAANPSIGVNYSGSVENAGTSVIDEEALAEQPHVVSYEQALSLRVLGDDEKSTPVKAPKEGSKAHKDLNGAAPILAFKDAQRRTLQVVSTKDGLAAKVVA